MVEGDNERSSCCYVKCRYFQKKGVHVLMGVSKGNPRLGIQIEYFLHGRWHMPRVFNDGKTGSINGSELKQYVENYRPFTFISITSEVIEHIVTPLDCT